jgi:hypothetical protein
MLKELVIIGIVLVISSATNAQDYKKWESHDIVRFYEKKQITLKRNEYIDLDNNALNKNGETFSDNRIDYDDTSYGQLIYLTPTNVKSGLFEIEVYEKISSKLWQIKGMNIYILFRFNPFLWKWDQGVLDTSNKTFYKKP